MARRDIRACCIYDSRRHGWGGFQNSWRSLSCCLVSRRAWVSILHNNGASSTLISDLRHINWICFVIIFANLDPRAVDNALFIQILLASIPLSKNADKLSFQIRIPNSWILEQWRWVPVLVLHAPTRHMGDTVGTLKPKAPQGASDRHNTRFFSEEPVLICTNSEAPAVTWRWIVQERPSGYLWDSSEQVYFMIYGPRHDWMLNALLEQHCSIWLLIAETCYWSAHIVWS